MIVNPQNDGAIAKDHFFLVGDPEHDATLFDLARTRTRMVRTQ